MDNAERSLDKKILLTGAAGFIGYHLAKGALELGARVVGCDNLNPYYDPSLKRARINDLARYERFEFVEADVANETRVDELFASLRPEIVVNLAAQAGVRYSITHPRVYIDSNIVGFYNVLESCRRYPVEHLLFASSSSVYGLLDKETFSETDDTDSPVSLYAATKKSNELFAHAYSRLYRIPCTGLRFFTVYGPFGRPDMAAFVFARKIMNDEPIQLFNNGDMLRDFTYVDDVAQAICRALDVPPKPNANGDRFIVYNIGNNRPEKLTDFVAIIERLLGKKAKKEYLPMQPGDVYRTQANVDAFARDFQFRPNTSLEEGLARFIAWFKEYYRDAPPPEVKA